MNSYIKCVKKAGGVFFKVLIKTFGVLDNISIILTYHRVTDVLPKGLYDPAMFVTTNSLEMHIKEISRFFNIVPLETILESNKKKGRLCAITFDDGWVDNYDFAFPIIRKLNVPATIFIPVEIIGTKKRFWFQNIWNIASQVNKHDLQLDFIRHFSAVIPAWKPKNIDTQQIDILIAELKHLPAQELDDLTESAYLSLGLTPRSSGYILNWEQILEMSRQGITFGSHGLNHYILPCISHDMKKREIIDSLQILKRKEISVSSFFSFPNGDFDSESLALVNEAGYKGALTTRRGYNVTHPNQILFNRIAVHEDVSNTPSLLWFRILQAISRPAG